MGSRACCTTRSTTAGFPRRNQSRIQWEGIDGTSIEALGSLPIDAGRAESFLRMPRN